MDSNIESYIIIGYHQRDFGKLIKFNANSTCIDLGDFNPHGYIMDFTKLHDFKYLKHIIMSLELVLVASSNRDCNLFNNRGIYLENITHVTFKGICTDYAISCSVITRLQLNIMPNVSNVIFEKNNRDSSLLHFLRQNNSIKHVTFKNTNIVDNYDEVINLLGAENVIIV